MKVNSIPSLVDVLALILFCSLRSTALAQAKGEPAVVYTAKKIITKDQLTPEATAVVVADGRIFAVESLEEVRRQSPTAMLRLSTPSNKTDPQ